MAAYDLAQRLLPGQAPTEHTIRRRLVAVAMFALCVAFGGFLLAGAQSRLIFQMMILIANFTVFFLGLLVIYFFMPISSGIPGLPISADRLISVTLAVSVLSGSDPTMIRAKLRNALPRAPEKQLYDPVLLHTSFARLLGHPKVQIKEMKKPYDPLQFFDELVAQVNNKIRGFEAAVSELWFVEEYDVLALALNGRIKTRRFHLGCQGN